MAAPKNNLDELRRLHSGGKPTVTVPAGQSINGASKFKFKPAGGNATPGSNGPLTEPSFLTRKLQKSTSDGPSRVKASALVSALSKAQTATAILVDSTTQAAPPPPRRAKRGSSEHQPPSVGVPSLKRPKWDNSEPLRNGAGAGTMENVEDIDMPPFAETFEDEEEAMWNEMHSASVSATTNAPPPSSRRGSAAMSQHRAYQASRQPTPSASSQHRPNHPLSATHQLASSQGTSRAGTPYALPAVALPPAPASVPVDLQAMSTLELQRMLISNYKNLTTSMASIIDDPTVDRFVFDFTRNALNTRIAGIESAISWRASFEEVPGPHAAGSGGRASALGLHSGSPSNPGAPMTPSTPGPFMTDPTKREPKLETQTQNLLLSSPGHIQTPTRERIYPRLPNDAPKSPSPRHLLAGGVVKSAPLPATTLGSGKNHNVSKTESEVVDLESDADSDIIEISSVAPPKPPAAVESRSLNSIPDANVTRRSPRKLKGIDAMPVPIASGSGSGGSFGDSDRVGGSGGFSAESRGTSKEDSLGTQGSFASNVSANIESPPLDNVATVSRHFAPLGPTQSMISDKEQMFDELDSDLNIPANVEEDSSTSVYKDEIMDKLQRVFGLPSFRTNQARAVDATMSGEDVFVLMPTGGGKSLCYQLPAVCTTGRTRGVTFVVSPLKSLMEDQVRQLEAKGVDVIMFNSDQSVGAGREARSRLTSRGAPKPSLVYVTPEKLEKSDDMKNILDTLQRQGQLARFVIDEAHCVSTWGRDFREAYQGLGFLRKQYEGVPIMALTATASAKVRADVITKLGIVGCVQLVQSFNRPNLHYEVRKKGKNVVSEIATYILAHHPGQTGVIYCLSRNKCEEVATQLRETHGITARHYHAAMTARDKSETQAAWTSGECNVIVATIAFGMGIDKADVRFVIHHQIPMSLSGYYQETGRAGRDGKPAQCILYYSFGDRNIMDRMIEQGTKDGRQPLSYEEQQRQKDDLRQVVQFCQNTTDCRRTQILAYFSEQFSARQCYKTCDNCVNHVEGVNREDMTDVACMAIELAKSGQNSRVTMNNLIDAFRASKSKAIRDKGLDKLAMFGKGSHLARELVERIFQHLAAADALKEELYTNKLGYNNPYIVIGDCAGDYIEGRKKFMMSIGPKDKGKASAPMAPSFASSSNKYQAPVTTRHTVKQKEPAPTTSKRIQSVNRTADLDDPFEVEPAVRLESPAPLEDDIEQDENYSIPPGFFDDPDQIETQEEFPSVSLDTNSAASHPAPAHASNPDIEDDEEEPTEGGFTGQFKKLKSLRAKMAKQFDLDPDDVFQEEILQELALLECTSEDEFKQALKSALGPGTGFDEKFELFGQPFMKLCLKVAGQPAQVKTPKISELHNQYDFKGASPKRAGRFKPAPSRAGSRKV